WQAEALDRYATEIGEQKTVQLSDGSELVLNTNTRVLIDYTDSKRRAILDQGEAYFKVAEDAQRPFSVDAGVRSIAVLGTEFNVQKTGGGLTVAVVEGLVAVHRPEEKLLLSSPADSNSAKVTHSSSGQ